MTHEVDPIELNEMACTLKRVLTVSRLGAHLALGLVFLACGAPTMIGPEPNEPSTDPQATGAAQHSAAAEREEKRLFRHKALYNARAKSSIRRCSPSQEGAAAPKCWVETINPTEIHKAEMKVHSERAVYHRKAARDLRAAESKACEGIARGSWGVNPFLNGHILGVSPLEKPAEPGKKKLTLHGATVFIQPMGITSPQQLQQIMDCYSRHQAVIGYGPITTAADRSPLGEPGSRATVRELRQGFAVDVRAEDPFAAQAVWLRAQRLAIVK